MWVIKRAGARLVILDANVLAPNEELTQDLMAIVHVFSCRINGKRRYKRPLDPSQEAQQGSTSTSRRRGANSSGEAPKTSKKPRSSSAAMSKDTHVSHPTPTCMYATLVSGRSSNVQLGHDTCAETPLAPQQLHPFLQDGNGVTKHLHGSQWTTTTPQRCLPATHA